MILHKESFLFVYHMDKKTMPGTIEGKSRLEQVAAQLKSGGYRLTPQRMAVLKILLESGEHLSVEGIHERLKHHFPTTSLATIYKTVALLKDMGEVQELSFGREGSLYDGRRPEPHPHLICVRCRKVIDPELSLLDGIPQELTRTTGYRLLSHRLEFYGLCPTCQQEEDRNEHP